MKRKALLIGNSNGLPGVKKDILNWRRFLKSDQGGQWFDEEIKIMMNPTKMDLNLMIHGYIKRENPDFAIVIFSGHGAYQRETILELNEREEFITENELIGIAPRQISIFDCCREILLESSVEDRLQMRSFSEGGVFKKNIRPYYDARIMNAIPQQVRLYACSIGESALDSGDGAMYMKNLLESSLNISTPYKLVGTAHEEAKNSTIIEANRKKHKQTPDACLPKCLLRQQLIISINPNLTS